MNKHKEYDFSKAEQGKFYKPIEERVFEVIENAKNPLNTRKNIWP